MKKTINIDDTNYQKLKIKAAKLNVSVQSIINDLIKKYVKKD